MSQDPSILRVEACGQERLAVQARLSSHCFRKPVDARGLEWRYERNPHGKSIRFVQALPDGEAVSGYACNPRRLLSKGDPASAAVIGETGDVMTHPEWRKLGLFSALDAAARERSRELGWPAIFGLPNQRSAHIFLELGWKEVGRIAQWTHLLEGGREIVALRRAEGRFAALCVPLDRLRAQRGRERLRRSAGGLVTAPLTSFPSEVRELSRLVGRDFAWMVERDADYLRWRFLESPSGLHRCLAIRNRTGAFLGYSVVQLPRAGERVGYLVDLLAADASARAAGLLGALQLLHGAGAGLVRASAIRGSFWESQLSQAGFTAPSSALRRRRELSVILFVHDPEHPLSRAGLDASGWYLTDGDRDDETMG